MFYEFGGASRSIFVVSDKMEKIVLKLKVKDQLRRVNLEERPISIKEVQRIISQLFPSLLFYSLFYQDEEGDRILVETDLELGEALQVALLLNSKIPVIRLEVEERKEVEDSCKELNGEGKEEEKKEEKEEQKKEQKEQKEKKTTLFTKLPKPFFTHPFAKQTAKMILEKIETIHGNAFLGPFAASWGALSQGNSFLKSLATSILEGEDCEIPEYVVRHPFFDERCVWLEENQGEILKKFDRMEVGLGKLKEKKNVSFLPLDAQMMMLWACDGDVDVCLSHLGGCAGPNINVNGPGFSYVHSSSPGASFSFSFGDGSMGSSTFSSSSSSTTTTSSSPSSSSSPNCSTNCSANIKININGEDVVDVEGMSVGALKQYLREKNISFAGVFEKDELKSLVRDSVNSSSNDSPKQQPQQQQQQQQQQQPQQQQQQPSPPQQSKREKAIASLLVLGFPHSKIIEALEATNDDVNLAADRLLGQ